MKIEELENWIISDKGLKTEIELLARFSSAKSVGILGLTLAPDIRDFRPDWTRLLLAASILGRSGDVKCTDSALLIAHAGLICAEKPVIRDACALLLGQLSNQRAIALAETKGLIEPGLESRVGVAEQLLSARRELNQSIFLNNGPTIKANQFQRTFWDGLEHSAWVSASAPTASGKTFLILQWLIKEFQSGAAKLGVFIAPTRALVSEIERELLDLANSQAFADLRVSSLPLAALGDGTKPTILVFTQERLHIFLNSFDDAPSVDVAVIDEAQKLGDGLRGVILQDAVERMARSNSSIKLVFLSPMTENPELLIADAPKERSSVVVPSDSSTVTQNLFVAEQKPRKSECWSLKLERDGTAVTVGDFELHSRPENGRKRLSYIALAVGRNQTGTLVYANGADEAEKLAWQIYDGLEPEPNAAGELHPELKELSDFARDIIHPEFQLVELLKRGVAFHYGNMPSLLRSEIERLFTKGVIRFLVCTSTLIEGVNLACHTIVVRGPRKGNGQPMKAHDFWNLAGRAGRWGKDFHGNILCIDTTRVDVWPTGTPRKTRYPIRRETEQVLGDRSNLVEYLKRRVGLSTSAIDARLEQVAAYLLSWVMRTGSVSASPSTASLNPEYIQELDATLKTIALNIGVPQSIVLRHSGVSAIALQSLLDYFRTYTGPAENLLPSAPESSDAYDQFNIVFDRINQYLFPAFLPPLQLHALITVEWMRGFPLGQIIRNRINYIKKHKRTDALPKIIRETMREVEEYARFRVPKYLSAYLDVLRFYLEEIGQAHLFPADLKFELYLEYGVATKTLLSLVGLGLSRTSAIAINEFLAADDLDETLVLERLQTRRWMILNIPSVVKNEINAVVNRFPILTRASP